MRSARTVMIDPTESSVLAICPLCDHRDIGTDESHQRIRLLEHLMAAHESEAKSQRSSLKRWLARRGIAA